MRDQWYVEASSTWNDVLDEAVLRHADKVLFVYQDRRITYSQFHELVEDFARGLIEIGIRKNDVVGVWMTNCLEWVVSQFAVYRTGAVLLPLYSYYRSAELEYALKQGRIDALIMKDSFVGKIDALAILKGLVPELAEQQTKTLSSETFPRLRSVIVVDEKEALPSRHGFAQVLARGRRRRGDPELARRRASVRPFDVIHIGYTSGTTGFPKGGMSMHITYLSTLTLWSRKARMTSDDVILCHVPLFTPLGSFYSAGLGIRNGCTVVITEQFDPALSLRLIGEERVTYLPGTPSVFRMLLDHPDMATAKLGSLRGGHVAGAPLTEATMAEMIDVLGCRDIMQAWGLSECGGLSTVTTRDDPREKRLGSVGRPLACVDVRIVDPETMTMVPAGQPGEIVLNDVHPGSALGAGYFRMEERTRKAFTLDGFRTGDIGWLDEDGYLYLAGRIDDMFTVGGFNVYPAEIENQLDQLAGVREAFVVGIEDRRLGSVPAAWIAREEGSDIGAEAVIAFCKDRLSSQKVPRRVFFYELGALPMTAGGKIKKKELAKQTAAVLAAEAADAAASSVQPSSQAKQP